ncbi:CDP-diacylglycerol--serine O-phosphatidyltransferase [Antarcticimicrobium sediminis]|uniref:CDP-diacylglycerol--serine O-phosphatidyltransferase n=1 Tax=Antarcticimicrobium sediminis TaxID=2546227 RepID=A0A4R5EMZ9_9RHOB|nr:CDP-diacylglycerol--serine O-phosphatidyltransferase [Antarcticimicrobium sediminis]TDE35927.1 CDP-diacylglycerol--serine O-phosphatidyltransferase [Antarcticimicrobium sediminis]
MTEAPEKIRSEFGLIQLLPNMMTIAAICAGLSAIRFGVHGEYSLAVRLILVAGILDGLDGRVARLLRSDSKTGAELDSLADFLNFGVAPPLVIYFWAMQDMRNAAWLAVLVFAVCCVMRLARFNVSAKSEDKESETAYFVGIPSPAGALLVLLPIIFSFAFPAAPKLPDVVLCLYIVAIGLLLISRIPTWSFKTTKISRENVKFFLVSFAFVAAGVVTYAWITLVVLCLAYVGTIIWALIVKPHQTHKEE